MSKKILICITKSNFGGAQKYVFDIAREFAKDNEVKVLLGGNGILAEKLEAIGISVIKTNVERDVNVSKDTVGFFKILKIIYKENPDILHLNSSKMGILGAIAGRVCNIFPKHNSKIIFTAHGWAFNEDRNFWIRLAIKKISWLTVLFSDRTICVSEMTKKQIANWPFIKNKLMVIYNGIENINFIERNEARKFFDPVNEFAGKIWIGTLSELHRIKRQEDVINALSKIENQNFVFFICGEGERREYLQNLINNLKIQQNTRLFGNVQDGNRYLKAFDIFTLTSKSEALPYALLEAGKAELAVIATKVGGVPEIISNEENGLLVIPKNVGEIGEKINKLIENRELREKLGNNLKKTIDEKFSVEKMFEKTRNLYGN